MRCLQDYSARTRNFRKSELVTFQIWAGGVTRLKGEADEFGFFGKWLQIRSVCVFSPDGSFVSGGGIGFIPADILGSHDINASRSR